MMLEERFIKTMQFVELCPENKDAFSNEYASLLMTIGAEVDCLFTLNCGFEPNEKKCISDYVTLEPLVKPWKIELLDRDLDPLAPFGEWNSDSPGKSLKWWQAYNAIKHARGDNRECGSQQKVLDYLAGLCLLENLMLKRISQKYSCKDVPSEYSKLFYIDGWEYNSTPYNKYETSIPLHLDRDNEEDRALVDALKNFGLEGDLFDPPDE